MADAGFSAVVLLFLCLLSKASCEQFDVVFAAVEESFEGVKISLVTLQGSKPHNMQMTLRGSHLSQECGQDFFRCQDILVESLDMQQQLLFIPLQGGLALVTVEKIQQSPLMLHTDHLILSSQRTGLECSPSAVYKILDNYFAACSNMSTNLVSVLEIRLDKSSLRNSVLVQASDLIVPSFVGNVTNMSNFLHLEIDRNHEYIVLALGTAFFSLRPFDYSAEVLADVPSEYCDSVYQLVPLSSAQFYAYCTEHLYVYDIGEENWLFRDTFSRIGIPYQCPGLQTNISVFEEYIHLQYPGRTIENIDIEGDFISGVCFGNETQNYFAFADRRAGFFVLDLATAELSPISSSACQEQCYPLVTIANRYLIVRDTQASKMLVLDFFDDQLELMEILHIVAPLVTLLAFEQHEKIPLTTPTTETIVPKVPKDTVNKNVGGLVAGIVVTSVVVILVVVAAIVVAFVLLRNRSKSKDKTSDTCQKPDECSRHHKPDEPVMSPATPATLQIPVEETRDGRRKTSGTTNAPPDKDDMYTPCQQEDTGSFKSEADSCSSTVNLLIT